MARMKCEMNTIHASCLFKADGLIDSYMRVGVHILAERLSNMTRSTSSHYRLSTGSASLTTRRTLDTRFHVMLLGAVRYLLLGWLTQISR